MVHDELTINKIKLGKAFAIKNLKSKEFTLKVTKFIIENCGFEILQDCYTFIPDFAKKEYHNYFIKELELIKNQKKKITKEKVEAYINYIKFDFEMSESEKRQYSFDLRKGIDIN